MDSGDFQAAERCKRRGDLLRARAAGSRRNLLGCAVKVNANTLRSGHVIEHNGHLFAVIKAENIQPGKGTPVTQVDLRRLADGIKVTEDTLKTAGIPLHIVAGVVAMTRPEGMDYTKYVENVVKPNDLARAVKLADNYVNLKDRIAALIAGDLSAAEKVHKYGISLQILTEA